MPHRTPVQIEKFLKANYHLMDLPNQYLGDEPNTYRKEWDDHPLRWCMIASWPYQAAAGNQSIPSVYKSINLIEGHLCDRFYLPASPRDLRRFEDRGVPIFGIESKHQLMDFDVVGTSIAYPVLSINFFKMLAMSDIPIRWKDRAKQPERYPMIMVGGQAYGAPEHLAPVIDCFWLGEVEDEPNNPGIARVNARIEQFKREGAWQTQRIKCYEALAREFNYLYFPRFVDVHYGYEDRTHMGVEKPSKQVHSYTSNLPNMRVPFLKRIVKDMNAVVPLDDPPLLYSDPGMGAGDLEVGRGCPAWCAFCALTYRQKPYRQRSVPYMKDFAASFQEKMGGTSLVPFMPDFPMHTDRQRLISTLLEYVSDEVDAPAMRVDDFISDGDSILLQVHGGMDGITLGVEGNSQRMRDLVGKGCSDEDIREAVARAMRAGIRKIKLFMISNLPGEDEGDIFRVLKLAKDLADLRDSMNQPHVKILFSWTPLLIEAGTPFQWFAPPTSARALGDVWEEFRDIKIDFKLGGKAETNKATFFQLCQRASREVGEVLVDVAESFGGACFGGVPKWTRQALIDGLIARGFNNGIGDCYDERDKNDMFGWEFIDQGVSVELLWATFQSMREFLEETDSHTYDLNFDDSYHGNEWTERCDTRCMGKTCGTCDVDDLKLRREYIQTRVAPKPELDLSHVKIVDQKTVAMKVRARVEKPEAYRFVMNDHWRFNVRRSAYIAAHQLGLDWGVAKRTIRFASDDARYRDWTCGIDYVEFGLTKRVGKAKVQAFLDKMNEQLCAKEGDESTRWLKITEWMQTSPNGKAMKTDIDLSLWELELDEEPSTVLLKIDKWNATDYIPMILKQEGGYFAPPAEEVNARDYVEDMWLVREGHRAYLKLLLRGRPSPYAIVAALLERASWLDAASRAAVRLEAFMDADRDQYDFFRVACEDCAKVVPINVFDKPYNPERCPRCLDRHEGKEMAMVGV